MKTAQVLLVGIIGLTLTCSLVSPALAISPGEYVSLAVTADPDLINHANAGATLYFYQSGYDHYISGTFYFAKYSIAGAMWCLQIGKEFTIIATDFPTPEHHVTVDWHPPWLLGLPDSGEGSRMKEQGPWDYFYYTSYYFVAKRTDYSTNQVWVELQVVIQAELGGIQADYDFEILWLPPRPTAPANLPPNQPDLYGPYLYTDGDYVLQSATYVNKDYIFGAYTTDPEGDDIHYVFDWGDGTTDTAGPYSGGAHPMVTHSWSSSGIYNVTVRAKDSNNGWSDLSSPCTLNIQTRARITVLAYDQYGDPGDLPVYMDGQFLGRTGHTYTITEGTHTIRMDSLVYEYPNIYEFQYYYYDGTYDYDNPTTLSITADKTVTAYYYKHYRPYY